MSKYPKINNKKEQVIEKIRNLSIKYKWLFEKDLEIKILNLKVKLYNFKNDLSK